MTACMTVLTSLTLLLSIPDPVCTRFGLGSATFSLGYGNRTGDDPPGGGLVLHGTLLADLGESFGLGMEAGFYGIESEPFRATGDYPTTGSIIHVGGLVQYNITPGPVRPYVRAGMGLYRWSASFVGASAGGGIRYQPIRFGYFGFIEARWHENLQNLGERCPGFYTISAGGGLAW